MCGICGYISKNKISKDDLIIMNNTMIHRGPNDSGAELYEGPGDYIVGLAQRRLSILDLSPLGHQPMESSDGRISVVFNGEIYNFLELKERMTDYSFKSTCDTEVILAAYLKWGVDFVDHIHGMFAIAIYDKETGELILARDRIGKKPLYYWLKDGNLVFASELKPIMKCPGFVPNIRKSVIPRYMYQQYVNAPESIFEDVWQLEPGAILRFNKGEITKRKYWDIKRAYHNNSGNKVESYDEAKEGLKKRLKKSVADRMIADVPLGAFLSAGIDSSTVVSLMQSVSPGKVKTFTIGMEDEKYNEAVYAKEIADLLGTEHTEKYITEKDAKDVIPKLPFMFGEPFADSSQIPTYLVSQMTREHVTVSLSGDGGDELFCGYRSYESVSRVWNKMKKIPYPLRKIASGIITDTPLSRDETSYLKGVYLGARSPYELHKLEHEEDSIIKRIAKKKGKAIYRCMDIPKNYLGEVNHEVMLMDMLLYHPDDILVKVDRTAMAVSLETRVPMLDKDLVEFAWSLPIEYLREGDTGKKIIRDVLYRYVPKEMMERPKKGFSIPISKWLMDADLRSWAEELVDRKKIEEAGILDPDVVDRIWRDFTDRGKYRIQIWYILMFQLWYETEGPGANNTSICADTRTKV